MIAAIMLLVMTTACGSRLTHAELAAGNTVAAGANADASAGAGGSASPSADKSAASAEGGPAGGGALSSAGGATGKLGTGGSLAGASGTKATGGAPIGSFPPLVLGTFGVEGGLIGDNVASMPVGLHAWEKDVNARGGIAGRRVQIIYGGNDKGDPAQALAITQKLVEKDHVAGLIGLYDAAGGELGIMDYIKEHRIPVIGDSGGVQPGGEHPYFFQPQTAWIADAKGFVTTFVAQSTIKKVGVIYIGEGGAPAVADTIKSYGPSQGLNIVYSAQVSIAQPSYTAEVINARNAGAEGVILVMDLTSCRRLIQDANKQGWHPVFSGSFAFDQPIPPGDEALMNGLLAYSVTANFQSPTTADYRAAVARYVPGGRLGLLGPVAFAAGKVLEEIGPALGTGPVGPAELLNALYTLKPTTLDGYVPQFSFSRTSGHPYQNLCLQPTKAVNGKWTTPVGYKCVS